MSFLASNGTVLTRNTSTAGVLLVILIGLTRPSTVQSAPIDFQATTVISNACELIISGTNFSIEQMAPPGMGCGGRDAPVGVPALPLPGQATFFNQPAYGTVDVPGIPVRVAMAYGGGQPDLYKFVQPPVVPDTFTGTAGLNVVLSGTLQVCLEPANVQTPSQFVACDPEFANFGLIHIDVAGQANWNYYNGVPAFRQYQGYVGTAAAAPEPSHLGLAAGAAVLLFTAVSRRRRLNDHGRELRRCPA